MRTRPGTLRSPRPACSSLATKTTNPAAAASGGARGRRVGRVWHPRRPAVREQPPRRRGWAADPLAPASRAPRQRAPQVRRLGSLTWPPPPPDARRRQAIEAARAPARPRWSRAAAPPGYAGRSVVGGGREKGRRRGPILEEISPDPWLRGRTARARRRVMEGRRGVMAGNQDQWTGGYRESVQRRGGEKIFGDWAPDVGN